MALTYEELKEAQARAEAAGDMQAAQELEAAATRAAQRGSGESGFGEDTANFARGVRSGIGNTADTARGLWAKLGSDEDSLQRINQYKEARAVRDTEFAARSPVAFGVGKFTGEVAATLPLGGVGGLAVKGGVKAAAKLALARPLQEGTRKLAATRMLGEGATIGALYTDEDENMGTEMLKGAGLDLAAGAALSGLMRPAGEGWRWLRNQRAARKQLAETETSATKRIELAKEHGGYQLDPLTASSTRASHETYENLRLASDSGPGILKLELDRDIQIREKVGELINKWGDVKFKMPGIDDVTPTGTQYGDLAERIGESLTSSRLLDKAHFKQLYKEFDELALLTNTQIHTGGLQQMLFDVTSRYQSEAYKSVRKKILKDLDRWGLAPKETGQAVAIRGATPPPPSGKLTLENAEDLLQDINAYWKPTQNNQVKGMIGAYKKAINEFIDGELARIGGKVANGGEAVWEAAKSARKARSQFSDRWESKDIINRIMQAIDGDKGTDFVLSLSKLKGSDITKIQAQLLHVQGGQQVIDSMRQAPLIEALYKAIDKVNEKTLEGGVIRFNEKEFRKVINAIPRSTREALWGKEFSRDIFKSIRAWANRTTRPQNAGSSNPSGTFISFVRSMRFMMLGGACNMAMMSSGMMAPVVNQLGSAARMKAVKGLSRGETPDTVFDAQIADIIDTMEQDFRGANGRRYGDMMRTMARQGFVFNFTAD